MHVRKVLAVGGCIAWAGCMAVGFAVLQNYAATAGASRPPSNDAAAFLAAHRRPERALIAMAVHPLCPCTDASLSELGDLLARSFGKCDAVILEYQPSTPQSWPTSASIRELGGVKVPVIIDHDGKMAAAIGAQTSGHTVFIDASGVIRFHGGLTLSRGHRGRTPTQDAILAALGGAQLPISPSPVFGCALELECKPEIAQ